MPSCLMICDNFALTIISFILISGDIGKYDSNGFFFITDRMKELIKYKGYQVHKNILNAGVSILQILFHLRNTLLCSFNI